MITTIKFDGLNKKEIDKLVKEHIEMGVECIIVEMKK